MSRPETRGGGARLDAWARRKAKVAEREAAEARAAQKAATEAAMAEKSDAEICAELNLPDPQDLRPGDDFTAFLKKEVPERLRRLALRKLWLSDPLLANVDGLVDYGEDFTLKQGVGEVVATAYRVGKGFARPADEVVGAPVTDMADEGALEGAQALQRAGEAGPETGLESGPEMMGPEMMGPEMGPGTEGTPQADLETDPEVEAAPAEVMTEVAPEPQAPLRRRMRFEFADQETNTI